MSESTDTGTGLDDKDGKSMDSDVQQEEEEEEKAKDASTEGTDVKQEEEEEKAKDASAEGNAASSTPPAVIVIDEEGSESRDTSEGRDDKESKRMKFSDVKQEEEKAKDAFTERNESPSTPAVIVIDAEGSEKTTQKLSGKEATALPFKKREGNASSSPPTVIVIDAEGSVKMRVKPSGESRDISEGSDDKENKRMKYSDVKQEEEEEVAKSKDASTEGNASFKIPKAIVIDAEGSDKMTMKPPPVKKLVLGSDKMAMKPPPVKRLVFLPIKKREVDPPTQGQGETRNEVIPESIQGVASEGATQEQPEGGDSIQDLAEELFNTSDSDEEDYSDSDIESLPLFELQLTPADVQHSRLLIPVELARLHFPLPDPRARRREEVTIQLSDNDQEWDMALVYSPAERAFMIIRGWLPFVNHNNLQALDVVRFYRPYPRLHENHFLIEYDRRHLLGDILAPAQEPEPANVPEFRRENFLFQLELTPMDFIANNFPLPVEEVTTFFPVIETPAANNQVQTLIFTDAQNRDWCMDIVFDRNVEVYVIVSGWAGFVVEHNVEDMDLVKFYTPVQPLHAGHFLIEHVKRDHGAGTSQAGSSGGAKSGGDGDDSATGDENKEGDGEEPLQRSSYKGKAKMYEYDDLPPPPPPPRRPPRPPPPPSLGGGSGSGSS